MKTGEMNAVVWRGREVVQVERWPKPVARPEMALVRVRRAGICGSDIHYFSHGRAGAFVPTAPFVLGHELCGEVAEVGAGVTGLAAGMRVTVNPARACRSCEYCASGRRNLCRDTVMLGSASTTPPTDGSFAEYVAVRADQCFPLPESIDDAVGAMIEPLAVALEAVKKPRVVSGKRVLVMGGGPIGLLIAMVARLYGAVPVALSDLLEARRLAAARHLDVTLDPAGQDFAGRVAELTQGGFDLIFEASGSAMALQQAFGVVRPGGTIVQVGTFSADTVPIPANLIMAREIALVGSFRYGDVYAEAIRLIAQGRLNLAPLVTDLFPLAEADLAIRRAASRGNSIKIQMVIP